MVAISEWYERVNAVLPDDVPPPTVEEAVRAAKKLYRFVLKRKCDVPIKVTSGRRYSGLYRGVFYVNPDGKHEGGGWSDLIHDLSHSFFHRLSDARPHSRGHARLELRMRKEVLKRGWLNGTLKLEPKAKPTIDKHARVLAAIKRWEAKAKRAHNALVKLRRKERRLSSN